MVQVDAINAFNDNYIWALVHPTKPHVYVVDPGDAEPVMRYLEQHDYQLAGILVTHHHWDHTTGVAALKQAYPEAPVYGPQNSPFTGIEHTLADGDNIDVFGLNFLVRATPGHTLDHISYINEQLVFCGDTLFSGGCGRLFEGTPEQMWQSMQTFLTLSDETLVYCTHEYTQANMAFASAAQPEDAEVQRYTNKVNALREQQQMTLPSTIGQEKRINPFLRADKISPQALPTAYRPATSGEPSAIFAGLRAWKDNF